MMHSSLVYLQTAYLPFRDSKQLLAKSNIVSEIIRMRVDVLQSFSLPSHSSTPIVFRNLEDIAFCEDLCFRGHNLLEENIVPIGIFYTTELDRIFKAFSLLKMRPNDRLVLNAHHQGIGVANVAAFCF